MHCVPLWIAGSAFFLDSAKGGIASDCNAELRVPLLCPREIGMRNSYLPDTWLVACLPRGPAGRQEVASTVRSRLTNKRIAVMRRGGPAHRALDFVAGEYRSSGPPFVLTLHLDLQPHGWG